MNRIDINQYETKYVPMWWQKRNLTFTRSGYGRKIPTSTMIKYNNRWHRMYCCIYSNSGTTYIIKNKEWIEVLK